ncbi:MAG: S46 family peptidase [Bacteroidota bacterium]
MDKRLKILVFIVAFSLFSIHAAMPDEGMYPLSEIHKLNLKSHGLKITPNDIYNPGHVGLIDAIVQIGGCTGSFVSNQGLIITNHHCAFGAVQTASTPEHDLVTNGFLAKTKGEEIQAKGFTVRINDSYQDVSALVLSSISENMNPGDRTRTIDLRSKEIITDIENQYPGKRAEVAEMFAGKSYMLFIYTFLKDVRVVYVPPRSIGEFGGENDNWVWPRHTGDFSFLRAYTAPDGSPAEYSPSNIPFHPKKFLKVAPQGVDENDAVFLLGYPGRTYRHRPWQYISFENEVRMPYVKDLYQWEIGIIDSLGNNDRAVSLKLDSRRKGLANTMKNYSGKLEGLKRLPIIQKRQDEEDALQSFVQADTNRKSLYGDLFSGFEGIYQDLWSKAYYELTMDYLLSSSSLLNYGMTIVQASNELKKPDVLRDSPYMDRNFSRTRDNIKLGLQNYYEPIDKIFFKEMIQRALRLPKYERFAYFDGIFSSDTSASAIDTYIASLYSKTKLSDTAFTISALSASPEEMESIHDPFIDLARLLYPTYKSLKDKRQERDGTLSKLNAQFIDLKTEYLKKDFIPDANSTLRLTFGHIRGYSPVDAIYATPITTLRGIIEKTTGIEPFNTPAKMVLLYRNKNFGKYKNKKLKDVPVALLYDLDTSGGNSGSPLLNALGELVGVNFDRTYEATINDYAWSEDYSRSIAVDIRYVLWVLDKYANADNVLEELGVGKSS